MNSFVRRVRIPIDEAVRQETAAGGQPTMLLVSDDEAFREAAARALEHSGYRVLQAAHSGHALLAGLRSSRIDVLMTELAMADTSGPDLAVRLRKHHPGLRTVYLAETGTPPRQGVLVRPFTRTDLLDQIGSLLATC
jgi:CheY-like chemotaxis protein